jgi:hypothetical protein
VIDSLTKNFSGRRQMPDLTYATKEEIPEGLGDGAKEVNGKWVVKVVSATKLDEFRANNVAISQERDGLKAFVDKLKPVIGDTEPEEFAKAVAAWRAVEQQVKDGKLTAKEDIEAEVLRRTGAMKDNFERQNSEAAQRATAAEKAAAVAEQKWRSSIVARHVTDAVLDEASGAIPSALSDILVRAERIFKVGEDGKITAKDGEATIYGADGTTPMTPKEWMAKLRAEAPHFFKNSSGGGSGGGQGAGKNFGGFTKEAFDKLPAAQRLAIARKNKA